MKCHQLGLGVALGLVWAGVATVAPAEEAGGSVADWQGVISDEDLARASGQGVVVEGRSHVVANASSTQVMDNNTIGGDVHNGNITGFSVSNVRGYNTFMSATAPFANQSNTIAISVYVNTPASGP